jgi:hypothetical protein
MNVLAWIIDSVLLFGIICVSVYGAVILPAGSRLPMHFGPGGYTNWAPRNVGLLAWPALGAAVYVILIVAARGHHANSRHGLPLSVGLTIALALMLVNHVGAVRAAVNRSSRE